MKRKSMSPTRGTSRVGPLFTLLSFVGALLLALTAGHVLEQRGAGVTPRAKERASDASADALARARYEVEPKNELVLLASL